MKVCPTCHESYGNQLKFCPRDGSALEIKGLREDPLVGRELAGRYLILERLGAGGFGTVYRVKDNLLEDIEALKVFDRRRMPPAEAQEAMERFAREAKLLRRLGKRSQHIVGVTNFIEDDEEDLFYFAMEHVDGDNLAQVLIREGPLSLERTLALTRQLCQALSTAHEEGIVHRDLKLENLMVTRDGAQEVLKVLDFGIAKILGRASLTDLRVGAPGTPGYAAPEQVENPAAIDHRTDLFAVGVVLYGMLTGREPWKGTMITEPTSDGWSLLRATVEGEPEPPRKWREDLPKEMEAIILRLLSKKQEDRFESAAALEAALDGLERSMTTVTPGAVRVECEVEGVSIALKLGSRTVAQGTTPWSGRSLTPGQYRVEIKDRRYLPEERDVEVRSAEEVVVHLTANARPERPPLSWYLKRAAVPVAALLVGWVAWSQLKPLPELPFDAFSDHLTRSEVVRVEIDNEELVAQVDAPGSRSGDFQVRLAGLEMQPLMSRIAAAGVPVRSRGRASVRFRATATESAGEAPGSVLALAPAEGEEGGCSPCSPDQTLELEAGWYQVALLNREWALDSLALRVLEGRYRDEVLPVEEEARVFVPAGATLELAALLSPTELGSLLASARQALEQGRATEPPQESAVSYARAALELDPGNRTALEVIGRVASEFREAAVGRASGGDLPAAEAELARCVQALGEAPCGVVQSGVEEVRLALERARQDSLGRVRAAAAEAQRSREDSVQRVRLAEAQRRREDSIARARTAAASQEAPPARPAGSAAVPAPPPTRDPIAAERARQDSMARARQAATPPSPGPGAVPPTGTPSNPPAMPTAVAPDPTPAARPPAVAGLSLLGHEYDERARSFALTTRFTLSGPPATAWCVAARYYGEDGAPLRDRDGTSAVGGLVAALAELRSSGESQVVDAQRLTLPLAQLDNDLERTAWATARLSARVALWAKACGAVGQGERPLAETPPSSQVCLARYPAGVARCR